MSMDDDVPPGSVCDDGFISSALEAKGPGVGLEASAESY